MLHHQNMCHMIFLIVDDSSEMRKMIGSVIANECDQIFELENGEQVVAAYIAHRPDWILMDIQMKHGGGLQATQELKEQFPGARVIIVTQYDDRHFRDQAMAAHADAYILKDDLSVLRNLVRGENPGVETSGGVKAKS